MAPSLSAVAFASSRVIFSSEPVNTTVLPATGVLLLPAVIVVALVLLVMMFYYLRTTRRADLERARANRSPI